MPIDFFAENKLLLTKYLNSLRNFWMS